MKRSSMISIRLENKTLDELEKKVIPGPEQKFDNVSEAIRNYLEIGMLVDSYKDSIKDPKIVSDIEGLRRAETIAKTIASFPDSELETLAFLVKHERDGRYQVAKIR